MYVGSCGSGTQTVSAEPGDLLRCLINDDINKNIHKYIFFVTIVASYLKCKLNEI